MTDLASRLFLSPTAIARAEGAIDTLRYATSADCVIVGFCDKDSDSCRLLASGISDMAFSDLSQPVPRNRGCTEILASNGPVAVSDIDTLPDRDTYTFMVAEGFRCFVGAPICVNPSYPEAMVVLMARDPRQWNEADTHRLTETADTVASILAEGCPCSDEYVH